MQLRLREIAEAWEKSGDVRGEHLRFLGDISGIEVFGDLVMVMSFAERTKTGGGIILTDQTHEEARFQGKSGLVVAVGPQAFVDDARATFAGQSVQPGDWVMTRPSDGLEFAKVCDDQRGAVTLRLFRDVHIQAKLADPRLVW